MNEYFYFACAVMVVFPFIGTLIDIAMNINKVAKELKYINEKLEKLR